MLLKIEHRTQYRYDAPMRFVTQSHRLTPASFAGQQVREWRVEAEGAAFGAGFVDGAGDRVTTMTLAGPVTVLEIRVLGLVEKTDLAGVLRGHREVVAPGVYMRATHATAETGALRALSEGAIAAVGRNDALALAHGLAGTVADAIAYAPGETDAGTTAAEALERGRGVCQDHAHALIAVARAAGLPARYVSGYLAADAEGGAYEAAHAWAELHVEGLGWVGFDPANRCCPDARYVRLGSGRDAQAAAPIRGISRGHGVEELEVQVIVAAQQ